MDTIFSLVDSSYRFVSKSRREAAMTQWWVHSPPNNVARPDSITARFHIYVWVEFVVVSRLTRKVLLSRFSGLPPSTKKYLNSNSTRIEVKGKKQPRLLGQIWCIAVKLGNLRKQTQRSWTGRFPIQVHEEDFKNKVASDHLPPANSGEHRSEQNERWTDQA